EAAGEHRRERGTHAVHVARGLPLVRVDDVEALPVPVLHVDLAQTFLVVARDHEACADAGEPARGVQPGLRAGALDDAGPLAAERRLVVQRPGVDGALLASARA